jgi:hypothetical protein
MAAPFGRGDGRRQAGRGTGGDQLGGGQLGGGELVCGAHRPDQGSDPLAARLDRGDDDGVAAVAAARAAAGALGQDRRDPGRPEPVRPQALALPSGEDDGGRSAGVEDPGGVEAEQLAEHAARGRVALGRRPFDCLVSRSGQRNSQGGAHIAHEPRA